MRLGLHQSVRMEQRLTQSPQMIQAMQILQLSGLDLLDRIDQEMTENPFLEPAEPEKKTEEGEPGAAPGDAADSDASTATGPDGEAAEPFDGGIEGMIEVLERYERDFGDGPMTRTGSSEEADRKFEAMQNTPDSPKSVSEALIEQLPMLDLTPLGRELAEYLIYSLDHRGWLDQDLEQIAESCGIEGATVETLGWVLGELRSSIHPALGARDLRECLLLQLEHSPLSSPLAKTLLEDHLEDITTNRLPRIAKATGHSIEDVKHALETIRTLDPNPGADYGDEYATAIMPDVIVEEIDGKYEVRLTRSRIPNLTINPSYKKLLREARKGDGVQEWVKKRIESARWFIDAIHQRQSTLERIANVIFERQRGFLDKGIKGLVPLRMQEVADEVKVHISTVSRAVSGKHAQTPRGILPLKYFFTGGTRKESGGVASQTAIKERIRELVDQEDHDHPLSDDQLAALLERRDQIKIARRTVTKYRKALSIPSSSQRRTY